MRILLLFSLIILLSNCNAIEITKEATKATKSIKTSIDNVIKISSNSSQEEVKKDATEEVIEDTTNDKQIIDQEIANLKKEKKEKEKIIKKQKKETKINFLGKTSNDIKLMIGEPNLLRIDGNARTVRFDNNFCQLFLFSNAEIKNARVEYFEIRNKVGKLIINKEKIEKCYKHFKLI